MSSDDVTKLPVAISFGDLKIVNNEAVKYAKPLAANEFGWCNNCEYFNPTHTITPPVDKDDDGKDVFNRPVVSTGLCLEPINTGRACIIIANVRSDQSCPHWRYVTATPRYVDDEINDNSPGREV
jgi:hypothetical protein